MNERHYPAMIGYDPTSDPALNKARDSYLSVYRTCLVTEVAYMFGLTDLCGQMAAKNRLAEKLCELAEAAKDSPYARSDERSARLILNGSPQHRDGGRTWLGDLASQVCLSSSSRFASKGRHPSNWGRSERPEPRVGRAPGISDDPVLGDRHYLVEVFPVGDGFARARYLNGSGEPQTNFRKATFYTRQEAEEIAGNVDPERFRRACVLAVRTLCFNDDDYFDTLNAKRRDLSHV